MPFLAANNYVARFARDLPAADPREPVHYGEQWPALLPLLTHTPAHACPNHMHMLLWGAATPTTVRLFAPSPPLAADEAAYSEVLLLEGAVLFVPRAVPVSVRATGGQLLRLCFVDASNVRPFVAALSREALLSAHSALLLARMRYAEQSEETAELSPLWMRMRPVHAPLHAYLEGVVEEERRVGSPDFTDWQQRRRWAALMASLTMAPPSPPLHARLGRDSALLQWTSRHLPPLVDRSRFGFALSVCGADRGSEDCRVLTLLRGDPGLAVAERSFAAGAVFSAVVGGLEPDSLYRVRATMFYGAGAAVSTWAPAFRTLALSAPSPVQGDLNVTGPSQRPLLVFAPPSDDGGSPVLAYSVLVQYAGAHLPAQWLALGSWPGLVRDGLVSLELRDVLPNTPARFRVAASNAVGAGEPSEHSSALALFAPVVPLS